MVQGAPGTQEGGSGIDSSTSGLKEGQVAEPEPVTETRIVTETVVTRVDLELGGARVEVLPRLVRIDYGGRMLEIDIVLEESVTARGPLPD